MTWIDSFMSSCMCRTAAIACFAFVLLAPSRGEAQMVQSFADLALRVNIDDRLRVDDQSGIRTVGRLTRLTADEIAIQTDAGEKRFTNDAVRGVAVRGHSFRSGALIGAAVFAALGALAVCVHEGDGSCVITGSLGAAPIGAGIGLIAGALVPRTRTIYRAPESGVSALRPRAAAGQASLLEDLALRVNLDDQLQVDDQSGSKTRGRLTRLTADEITLETKSGERHFKRESIRQVVLRRRPLRMAVLIGAGAGAAAGAVAACARADREECPDAPIITAALGAGVGLAAGALMPATTVVYPDAGTRVSVQPVISRAAVGIQVSREW